MQKFNLIAIAVSVAMPLSLASAGAASAQSKAKKLTYEQAWAQCKKEIGANVPGSDTTSSAHRQTAGAACMKKYGYRLKE
jgi:hypothetical protein